MIQNKTEEKVYYNNDILRMIAKRFMNMNKDKRNLKYLIILAL